MGDGIIYIYGGFGEMAAQVFNALARIFASDSDYFTSVGPLFMGIGAIWAGTRAMFGGNIGIFGKNWFFPSFLAFSLMFVPKERILIVDEASKTQYAVDNVPAGIALLSSIPSKFAHYLSEEIEDQFNVADSNKSTHTGLMFGAKLAGSLKDVKIQDPLLLQNTKNFMIQCYMRPWIMGNILGKRGEAENAPNIAAWLSQAENQAQHFGIYLKDEEGNTEFKACPAATPIVLGAIEDEARSESILSRLGFNLGISGSDPRDVSRSVLSTGAGALEMLGTAHQNVQQWIKQSMILNAYREGLDDWREGAGHNRLWPHLVSMSATRGMFQQSFGWLTAGEMAASALPWVQTIFFLIISASALVVFPMCLLPGGHEILKVWAKGMIWIHTWPIFFAIINCLGQMLLQKMLGSQGEDFGLSKLTQESFSDKVFHAYAGVQMFASMIPVFSWMLISKSGYAFTSMVNSLAPSGVSSSLGVAAADGNINMDNVSTGNRTIAQQSFGGSLGMDSVIRSGGIVQQQAFGGESTFLQDKSAMRVGVTASEQQTDSLNKSYENSTALVESTSAALNESVTQTDGHAADLISHFGKGVSLGEGYSESQSKEVSEAHNIAQSVSDRLSKNYQESDAKRVGVEARAGLSTKGVISTLTGIDAGFSATGSRSKEEREIFDTAKSMGWTEDHSNAVRNATSASRSGNLNINSDEGRKASESYNASFAKTEQLQKSHSSALSHQAKVSDLISKVNTSGGGVSQELLDEYLEYRAISEHGGDKSSAASWVSNNQEYAANDARSWLAGKINSVSVPNPDLKSQYEGTSTVIEENSPKELNDTDIKARQERSGLGSVERANFSERSASKKSTINDQMSKSSADPIFPQTSKSIDPRTADFISPRGLNTDTTLSGKNSSETSKSTHKKTTIQEKETPLEKAHRLRREGKN